MQSSALKLHFLTWWTKKRKQKKTGGADDAKAQDPSKKDDKGSDDKGSDTEQPGTKRKKVQKELNDKLGKRGDKWPCFFFHHVKKCNFSAADCKNYHE